MENKNYLTPFLTAQVQKLSEKHISSNNYFGFVGKCWITPDAHEIPYGSFAYRNLPMDIVRNYNPDFLYSDMRNLVWVPTVDASDMKRKDMDSIQILTNLETGKKEPVYVVHDLIGIMPERIYDYLAEDINRTANIFLPGQPVEKGEDGKYKNVIIVANLRVQYSLVSRSSSDGE